MDMLNKSPASNTFKKKKKGGERKKRGIPPWVTGIMREDQCRTATPRLPDGAVSTDGGESALGVPST